MLPYQSKNLIQIRSLSILWLKNLLVAQAVHRIGACRAKGMKWNHQEWKKEWQEENKQEGKRLKFHAIAENLESFIQKVVWNRYGNQVWNDNKPEKFK